MVEKMSESMDSSTQKIEIFQGEMERSTTWKFDIDTKHDGLENASPFKHDVIFSVSSRQTFVGGVGSSWKDIDRYVCIDKFDMDRLSN